MSRMVKEKHGYYDPEKKPLECQMKIGMNKEKNHQELIMIPQKTLECRMETCTELLNKK
jgi:hypothetical protein